MIKRSDKDPQLVQGERILWTMRPHWIILVMPTIWGILLTSIYAVSIAGLNNLVPDRSSAPFVDWILFGIYLIALLRYTAKGYVDWFTTRYTFTNQRVITRSGLIVINGETLPLDKVHSIQFQKTLLERLFGSGSLRIESAADNEAIIRHVTRAEEVHADVYAEIAKRNEADGYSAPTKRDAGPIDFS
jgi:uncharacterized membrane protein YdbT with pleckstrin-like domain